MLILAVTEQVTVPLDLDCAELLASQYMSLAQEDEDAGN